MSKKLFSLFLILIVILTGGFGCKVVNIEAERAFEPISLEYWGVESSSDDFRGILAKYKEAHPNITVNYRKFRFEEYEKELINALAEDRGPDIFSIHNTAVREYLGKLAPMPAEITMAHPVIGGGIQKTIMPELRTVKSLTMSQLRANFADVVYGDAVVSARNEAGQLIEQIYALPLAMDTMALYYNRDLLNDAGIPSPPAYWNKQFQQNVAALTKQDVRGRIVQAGVALGGASNIDRSSDILSLLMIQNGAEMLNVNGVPAFHRIPDRYATQRYNPGIEALRFYTDFANPAKEVYAWNSDLENSLEMFTQGKLAFMIGYSYHYATIKSRAPKLNFDVATLPQIENTSKVVSFANYWMEGVSKKSAHIGEAWDFVQFATREGNVDTYLESIKKPSALRSLSVKQISTGDYLSIFAGQVLTAQSWYKGNNPKAMAEIFNEMILAAISGQKLEDVISLAASKINQTIK